MQAKLKNKFYRHRVIDSGNSIMFVQIRVSHLLYYLKILHVSDKHGSELDKVAVSRIFNFNDAPGILSTPDLLAVYLDHGVGTNNCKWDGLT